MNDRLIIIMKKEREGNMDKQYTKIKTQLMPLKALHAFDNSELENLEQLIDQNINNLKDPKKISELLKDLLSLTARTKQHVIQESIFKEQAPKLIKEITDILKQ